MYDNECPCCYYSPNGYKLNIDTRLSIFSQANALAKNICNVPLSCIINMTYLSYLYSFTNETLLCGVKTWGLSLTKANN